MDKYIFKCTECDTLKIWETKLEIPAGVEKCICGYPMSYIGSKNFNDDNI